MPPEIAGAAAAARCRDARRPERRLPLHAGGAGAARLGAAIAGAARGRADDHAVAAHAGGDRPSSCARRRRARRASSGTATGENPYPQFLAHADAFIAPADSVNMTGEPCATGKPVYVFEPEGGSAKFTRFHEALRRHGATRPLPERFERLETWSYAPLNSSETIAAEIARRWLKRRQMLGAPPAAARRARPDAMALPDRPAGGCHRALHGEHRRHDPGDGAADDRARSGPRPDLAEARRHVLPGEPRGVHPRQRLGGRPRRRLHDVPAGARRVHGRLHRLRVLELARRSSCSGARCRGSAAP